MSISDKMFEKEPWLIGYQDKYGYFYFNTIMPDGTVIGGDGNTYEMNTIANSVVINHNSSIFNMKSFMHDLFGFLNVIEDGEGNEYFIGIEAASILGFKRPTKAIQDYIKNKQKKTIDRSKNRKIFSEIVKI